MSAVNFVKINTEFLIKISFFYRAYQSMEISAQSTHHLDANIELKIIEGSNLMFFIIN